MPVNRGSLHKLVIIPEATFGVTPATPAMQEIPIVSFNKTETQKEVDSAQLRSHPFLDRILSNGVMQEATLETELQNGNHDLLFQALFASTVASKSMKFTDGLSSFSAESQAGGGSGTPLFDQFAGMFLSKLDLAASASDTAPVKCTWTGMALLGNYDQTASIATSVTPATYVDPYVYADGQVTINGVARPVTACTLSIERKVNELDVLGQRTAMQFVPDSVTVSGQVTIPYEDALESARFTNFVGAPMVFTFSSEDRTTFRTLSIPQTKYTKLNRNINVRGALLQVIDFKAFYDQTSATAVSFSTQ